MAHFAQIDSDNRVIHVSAVNNAKLDPENEEASGIAYLQKIHGANTRWVQTSYNGSVRGRYAGLGYTWDAARDAFIAPKPFPSWVLNEETTEWEPPIPKPAHGEQVRPIWNETEGAWDMMISQRDFLRRITPSEWKDMEESTDSVVMYFVQLARIPGMIDLSSDDADQALTYMEAAGKEGGGAILASGRKAEILDPNPTP